MRPKIPCSVA